MGWIIPKTTWNSPDKPVPSDFNRIEENTQYLSDALDSEVATLEASVASEAASRAAADNLKQDKPSTSSADITDFPIGTTLLAWSSTHFYPRNAISLVYKKSGTNWQYSLEETTNVLAGYWRNRGAVIYNDLGYTAVLVERVE